MMRASDQRDADRPREFCGLFGVYGVPDAQTIRAIETCARLEGMLTDTAMQDRLRATSAHMQSQSGTQKAARLLDITLTARGQSAGEPACPSDAGHVGVVDTDDELRGRGSHRRPAPTAGGTAPRRPA